MDVSALLEQARTAARLTQVELAKQAGLPRSAVGDYERGRNAPTVKQLERLLAAAGFQLAVQLEPLGADIEQAVRGCMGMPIEQRVEKLPAPLPLETFIGIVECVPYVIEGAAAAFLQGAPLPVEAVELAVPDDDALLATLGRSIGGSQMLRFWIEDQQIWYMINPSVQAFRAYGPTSRWKGPYGEARIRLMQDMPVAVHIEAAGMRLPVVPLWEIEVTDERVAAILTRTRKLAAQLRNSVLTGTDTAKMS